MITGSAREAVVRLHAARAARSPASSAASGRAPCSRTVRCSSSLERLLARADGGHLDVVAVADQLDDRRALRLVVLDHEQVPDAALEEARRSARTPRRGAPSRPASRGTRPRRRAARAGGRCSAPVTMCTGMWRVSGWCLRWSSTAQPSIPGSCMSRTIASGLYSCASARPTSPRSATMPLKPRSRAISSTVARSRVVLDDQDDAVARRRCRRGRRRRPSAAASGGLEVDARRAGDARRSRVSGSSLGLDRRRLGLGGSTGR